MCLEEQILGILVSCAALYAEFGKRDFAAPSYGSSTFTSSKMFSMKLPTVWIDVLVLSRLNSGIPLQFNGKKYCAMLFVEKLLCNWPAAKQICLLSISRFDL